MLKTTFLTCVGWVLAITAAADSPARPNVVVFLVDDLGWGAIGAYGNEFHETPHIDALCRRGMRFSNAYSACTVCSPSRAAILTGRYPARLHLTDWIAGHERPDAKLRIPDWSQQIDHTETTLPEALREHGYRTAFFGKWHLIPQYKQWSAEQIAQGRAAHSPDQHGFDVNVGGREWGQPNGRGKYFYPFDMPGLHQGRDGDYLTDRLTEEAIRWLDGTDDQPFLLYMSYYTVHTPVMAKQADVERFEAKRQARKAAGLPTPPEKDAAVYAAMHASLDDSVGRIVDHLAKIGKQDNTIIFFTGDNGGDRHSACGGLRGRKATAFEGGVREPTCIVWPGTVAPDTQSDEPIIGNDFYPTILEMAGLPSLPGQHCDGESLVPLLRQSGGLKRDALFWHYPHYHRTSPYGAIRRGDWKLIEFYEDGKLMLFNLADDPHEQRNLAAENAAMATQLLEQLQEWRADVNAQMPTAN
ncbi:MAG: sulfatase [Planctomycetales bacterium]|nr:sulfatase [Planctomycetales bacterium]